jgi:hypothetical protein
MSKFINSTYYASEDIQALINWVNVDFPLKHPESFAKMTPLVGESSIHRDFNQIRVSFYSGAEAITAEHQRVWNPKSERLLIGIKRRNLLMGSDLAALSLLTVENPTVPRPLVINLVHDLLVACFPGYGTLLTNTLGLETDVYYNFGAYRQQMEAVLERYVPQDMVIRILPRAASGSKQDARLAMLEDRVARRANQVKWDKIKVQRLEQDYDKVQRRLARNEEQLRKDNEELTALSAKIDSQEEA